MDKSPRYNQPHSHVNKHPRVLKLVKREPWAMVKAPEDLVKLSGYSLSAI